MLFDVWNSAEQVESMMAKGKAVMDQAIATYKPVAVFAAYSGGNDSIVSTHFACEHYSAAAINCNTLIGVDKTREHAKGTAETFKWDFQVKKAEAVGPPKKHADGRPFDPANLPAGRWTDGATAYEEFVFNFGFPGPAQHAKMYQRLKERSFDAWKREAKIGQPRDATILIVSGIRQDESSIRAGYKSAIQKNNSSIWVNPFYFTRAADFEAYRQEFSLPRNPVSDKSGISMECLCGAHASMGELEIVNEVEPHTHQYIVGLQDKAHSLGLPCQWGKRPTRSLRQDQSEFIQLSLFGDDPEFMPACVGCIRRRAAS